MMLSFCLVITGIVFLILIPRSVTGPGVHGDSFFEFPITLTGETRVRYDDKVPHTNN